jgi:iron-sulfur cluster assembly protein
MPELNPDVPVQFSPAAITEIRRFCQHQGSPSAQIRLSIAPGGCQGYHYAFNFQPGAQGQGDRAYIWEQVEVAIDPAALPALWGATLDYAEDLMGGNFRLLHPPVTELCACGLSFRNTPLPTTPLPTTPLPTTPLQSTLLPTTPLPTTPLQNTLPPHPPEVSP